MPLATSEDVADLATLCSADEATCTEEPLAELAAPSGPYLAARIVKLGPDPMNAACHLAIRTAAGWSVTEIESDCGSRGRYDSGYLAAQGFSIANVVGGPTPELVLRFGLHRSGVSDREDGAEPLDRWSHETSRLVVCGLAAGRARCTVPILLGVTDTVTRGEDEPTETSWSLGDAFDDRGALVLRFAKGQRAEVSAELLGELRLGAYRIAFGGA